MEGKFFVLDMGDGGCARHYGCQRWKFSCPGSVIKFTSTIQNLMYSVCGYLAAGLAALIRKCTFSNIRVVFTLQSSIIIIYRTPGTGILSRDCGEFEDHHWFFQVVELIIDQYDWFFQNDEPIPWAEKLSPIGEFVTWAE